MSLIHRDPVTGELPADLHQRHHLVAVLFEGAKLSLRHALSYRDDATAFQEGLDRAGAIVASGLRASLNLDSGGELAERLDSLYDYMLVRLQEATPSADDTAVVEVLELLENISAAWQQIGSTGEAVPA